MLIAFDLYFPNVHVRNMYTVTAIYYNLPCDYS